MRKKPAENSPMQLAINEAKKAWAHNEVPIGAVIIDSVSGQIVATSHNLVESNNDPTAHAEILAIRSACQKIGNSRLATCDIYVTLEPCPMCAQAISFARLRRLYFGAYDPKGGGVENGPRIFFQQTCHHKPEIVGGLEEMECSNLIKKFFADKR